MIYYLHQFDLYSNWSHNYLLSFFYLYHFVIILHINIVIVYNIKHNIQLIRFLHYCLFIHVLLHGIKALIDSTTPVTSTIHCPTITSHHTFTIKLKNKNYLVDKIQFLPLLNYHNLISYNDGSILKPPSFISNSEDSWKKNPKFRIPNLEIKRPNVTLLVIFFTFRKCIFHMLSA